MNTNTKNLNTNSRKNLYVISSHLISVSIITITRLNSIIYSNNYSRLFNELKTISFFFNNNNNNIKKIIKIKLTLTKKKNEIKSNQIFQITTTNNMI